MNKIAKYHDAEITGIVYHQQKAELELILSAENIVIVLSGVEYWELSEFAVQNVIFELNSYPINNLPEYLTNDYTWLNNFKDMDVNVLEIAPSAGMGGVIVYTKMKNQDARTKSQDIS